MASANREQCQNENYLEITIYDSEQCQNENYLEITICDSK